MPILKTKDSEVRVELTDVLHLVVPASMATPLIIKMWEQLMYLSSQTGIAGKAAVLSISNHSRRSAAVVAQSRVKNF